MPYVKLPQSNENYIVEPETESEKVERRLHNIIEKLAHRVMVLEKLMNIENKGIINDKQN